MPRAKLAISIPETMWINDVSQSHPQTTFKVVSALAGERTGIALIELQMADPLPVITDMADRADVVDFDLLWKGESSALLHVETTSPSILQPVLQSGIPIEMPFTVRNGEATWTVTAASSRFSEFGRLLDELGIEYTLEYVHEIGHTRADDILTERQREVLLAALERGYYATPREATLTDVASDLDISKATCSETLHRAEGSVIRWFADEHTGDARAQLATDTDTR
ncbi:helix-turn-helix domain-containing protein [Natrinema sp. HArc-T2]|uniref:helix-turn-helix domain-containing protein n=1 Tax=Natrinema sp. HArc-T2 TaxID=3242701 RepID=UPI00359E7E50